MSGGTDRPRSRRELVADVFRTRATDERRQLLKLLDIEFLAAEVYFLASESDQVSAAGRALARRLEEQERSHAAALAKLIGLPEASRPEPPVHAVQAELSAHGINVSFGSLRSERQWFTLLERLEGALEGAYFKALGHLKEPAHAMLAARILASEAQHSTILFSFRNPQNVQLAVAVGLVKGSAAHHG